MNRKVDIIINEYNDTERFVIVKRGDKNLYMEMGICQFVDEMDYWGMPVKTGVLDNNAGYIFSNEIEIEDIEMEIKRFIIHNDI